MTSSSPPREESENDSEGDVDLWSFYDNDDVVWDYPDRGYASLLLRLSTSRVLVPVIILCQSVISLINLICALALNDLLSKYRFHYAAEFKYVALFWLVISFFNTIIPIIMLALFRLESLWVMRTFVGTCCLVFVLLLLAVVQSIIMLNLWIFRPKSTDESKKVNFIDRFNTLTVAGIVLGMCIQTANAVVTSFSMYMVHEHCSVFEERNRGKRVRTKSERDHSKKSTSPRSKV